MTLWHSVEKKIKPQWIAQIHHFAVDSRIWASIRAKAFPIMKMMEEKDVKHDKDGVKLNDENWIKMKKVT